MTLDALLKTLPRHIKVGPYDWTIVLDNDPDKTDLMGATKWQDYTITLWPHMIPTPPMLVGVVLHELLHAIWGESDIDEKDLEESVVRRFEFGLIALYRDNPKLLQWISRGLQ